MFVNRCETHSHLLESIAVPLDDDARRRAAETKRERTLRAILDAVDDVMGDENGFSIAAVSREAGISEATIYRYFASKDDLYKTWFADWLERNIGRSDSDPREAVGVLVMQLVNLLHKSGPGSLQAWRRQIRGVMDAAQLDQRAVGAQILRGLLNFEPLDTSQAIDLVSDQAFHEWGGLEGRASRKRQKDAG